MSESPVQEYRQRLLRFVSDAVHDLVGPVDQVASLAALFVRKYRGQLDADADNLLMHIESAAARLANTGAGLRSYFNVTGSESVRTRVNSRSALESAILELQSEIQACQAEISFGELPDVEADPNLVKNLFQALIQNSLKFRREGSPPRVHVSAESSAPACRFSISDNGIGIDPKYAGEVFVAFRKLNGHKYPGAGMGLTVARAIVETFGGTVFIGDHDPPGATVIFELPAAPPTA